MPALESHETVPRVIKAVNEWMPSRALRDAGTMRLVGTGAANIVRFISLLLASALIALPGSWAALALWYQGPAGQPLKAVVLALWTSFLAGVLFALWQGRAPTLLALFV